MASNAPENSTTPVEVTIAQIPATPIFTAGTVDTAVQRPARETRSSRTKATLDARKSGADITRGLGSVGSSVQAVNGNLDNNFKMLREYLDTQLHVESPELGSVPLKDHMNARLDAVGGSVEKLQKTTEVQGQNFEKLAAVSERVLGQAETTLTEAAAHRQAASAHEAALGTMMTKMSEMMAQMQRQLDSQQKLIETQQKQIETLSQNTSQKTSFTVGQVGDGLRERVDQLQSRVQAPTSSSSFSFSPAPIQTPSFGTPAPAIQTSAFGTPAPAIQTSAFGSVTNDVEMRPAPAVPTFGATAIQIPNLPILTKAAEAVAVTSGEKVSVRAGEAQVPGKFKPYVKDGPVPPAGAKWTQRIDTFNERGELTANTAVKLREGPSNADELVKAGVLSVFVTKATGIGSDAKPGVSEYSVVKGQNTIPFEQLWKKDYRAANINALNNGYEPARVDFTTTTKTGQDNVTSYYVAKMGDKLTVVSSGYEGLTCERTAMEGKGYQEMIGKFGDREGKVIVPSGTNLTNEFADHLDKRSLEHVKEAVAQVNALPEHSNRRVSVGAGL